MRLSTHQKKKKLERRLEEQSKQVQVKAKLELQKFTKTKQIAIGRTAGPRLHPTKIKILEFQSRQRKKQRERIRS